MALDVLSLVATGFRIAKGLVPGAFAPSIVKLGPVVGAYDAASDSAATTWLVEKATDVFGYDDEEERKTLPVTEKQRTFLIDPNEFDPGQRFEQTGEVHLLDDVGAVLEIWNVYRVNVAPSGAVAILFARR